ncbi:hypothetical protein AMTR_s00046p00138700 [Amborella trichopoda]|uniref:Bulb-type lectin domain-containing protein n=1 Tax=Amborella trichopoda TaxID=13333 RepID=U5DC47_AMBTC|nr:hypothetical protein AMTR_s00046p00138700 [Amborella trichopoda]
MGLISLCFSLCSLPMFPLPMLATEPLNQTFLLSKWFDKILSKTLIWSANRDLLLPRGSTLELKTGGELFLNVQTAKQIWRANMANSTIASTVMQDYCNFMFGRASTIL